jgi:hypothetical protein
LEFKLGSKRYAIATPMGDGSALRLVGSSRLGTAVRSLKAEELFSQHNDWLEAIASDLKLYGFQRSRQPTGRGPVFITQQVLSTVLFAS